ncbi:TonB-linked outer membrane protein, SusC/RagA family [Draconibacterium orientale]|uniref:TonB-dependent receptor n=2 Tax=Draconibacterium orientale TaxID=1168034 RepID=X5DUI5_9BACT|nr:TonB-dependent receptor [Draconibacterium orientale]SET47096.1 TonB-linked outer membrane protein, SusC/RagA family [Draconibacterium orientale]
MKKNATCFFLYFNRKKKLLLAMKLVLILLLTSFTHVSASTSSNVSDSDSNRDNTEVSDVQQNVVSGKVTDNSGAPLPGVTVVVKGTNNGVITDTDGSYSLSDVSPDNTLIFSFIGMQSQEVAVGNQTVINITMEVDVIGIEEVVTIGYGVQKKTTVTGAISTVKGEELAKVPVPNISQALAGKLAGVSMRPNGGQPGFDDPDIHIRGVVTTGNSDPLVVVDGVKRDNIRQVDPATIESVTILKDAAAVAPYGIGGANGVILITTKKGTAGKPVVRLTSSYGIQNPTYLPEMLNAQDYMALQNEGYYNLTPNGTTPPNNPDLIADYPNLHRQDPDLYPDSKFIDHWNTNVPVQNYNLEFSGGSSKFNYHAGLGYYDQAGIVDKINYKRYSYNISLGLQATNTTKVSMSIHGSIEDTDELDPGESTRGGHLFRTFYKFVPIQTLLYSDGEHWGESSASSPIAALKSDGYTLINRKTLLTSITVEQELPFIEGLNFKGVFSYDPNIQRTKQWHLPFIYHVIDYSTTPYSFTEAQTTQEGWSPLYSYLRIEEERWSNFTYQAYLNYARTFGDHSVTGLLVAEARESTRDNFWTRRNNFAILIDEMDFGSSDKNDYDNGGASATGSEIGYVYRVGYSYMDKYLLEASGRYDGHYYFAPGERWGYFPAFSAAWRVSEEGFMADKGNINNLKLRASWGQSGMLAGEAFQYLAGYSLRGNAYAFGNGSLVQGSANESEPNPEITWEVSTKMDIGFDLNMWDGLLNLEFDYFHEKRTGMLLAPQVTLPVEYGLDLSEENKGEMKNNGIEINASSVYNVNDDMVIGLSANFSYAKNQMVEVFQSDAQANNPNRTLVGQPFGTPYGYKALGLFTTAEDTNGDGIINSADGYNVEQFGELHPGDIKYADLSGPDGVPDGKIDSNDETKIGYPVYPLMTFGFTPTLEWKNLDVALFFQGAAKASIRTYQFMTVPFENNGSNTSYEYFDNRWTPENQNAKYPRATPSPYNNNTQQTDFWMVNTNYLRLKTATIGYTLPNRITDKLGIGDVRCYVTGQNVFTISKLKHVDPEMGYDLRETAYPVMRSTTFGIDITF